MRQDIWQHYIQETWTAPESPLPPKMLYYRDHFMSISGDGFIHRPRYMDVYMPHSSRVAIGQLRVSSHQLEIEARRAARVPRAERICRLCREEVETEDHFVCRCRAHQGVRDRYAGLFEEHSSLHQLMEASDQRQLGRLLLELHSSRERLLQTPAPTRGGRQSQLTDFFQRAMPVPADVPRGVTAQRAEELRARRRPRQTGHRAPRLRHREIAAIRMRHQMETQERLARFHSDSGYMFMPFTASASAMYDILYPSYGTGWS